MGPSPLQIPTSTANPTSVLSKTRLPPTTPPSPNNPTTTTTICLSLLRCIEQDPRGQEHSEEKERIKYYTSRQTETIFFFSLKK